MVDDVVGSPLFGPTKPKKYAGDKVLTATDIARKAGVPPEAMNRVIAYLVTCGNLIPQVTPLCQQCGAVMGDYLSAEDVPDESQCLKCDQLYDISELVLRITYVVVDFPKD